MSLFVSFQRIAPQRAMASLSGWLANSEFPPLAQFLIWFFRQLYTVDLTEAEREKASQYVSFNDFFTRTLKLGKRPITAQPESLVSPADGFVASFGPVASGSVLQAKGEPYSLERLLANRAAADALEGGSFITVYLSPKDYHRVHMPTDGTLVRAQYVPGELFSVNARTEAEIPNLFARNERLVCEFDSERGPFAVVLVGAMIVGGIRAIWTTREANPLTALKAGFPQSGQAPLPLLRGAELGHFELGSTAIVVTSWPQTWAEGLAQGQSTRMGQRLADPNG